MLTFVCVYTCSAKAEEKRKKDEEKKLKEEQKQKEEEEKVTFSVSQVCVRVLIDQ